MPGHARATQGRENSRSFGGESAAQEGAALKPPHYGIDFADNGHAEAQSSITPIYKGIDTTAAPPPVQAMPVIDEADGEFGQETDRVAEHVMSMSPPAVQAAPLDDGESPQAPLLQAKPFPTVKNDTADTRQGSEPDSHAPAARAEVLPLPVQAKLTIGAAGDEFEQEADRVAEQVMNMPPPALQAAPLDDGESPQVPLLQAKAISSPEGGAPDTHQGDKIHSHTVVTDRRGESPPPVQAKLTIGAVGDEFEQEADRVAEQVMSMPSSVVQAAPLDDEEKPRASMVQAKAMTPAQHDHPGELDRHAIVPSRIEESASDFRVNRSTAGGAGQGSTEGGEMERAANFAIRNKGAGSPLASSIRPKLEAGTGSDLSKVRVHSDPVAHSAAGALGARAFTHRSDIWLGKGESQSDVRLMAHESTHVVQQTGSVQRLAGNNSGNKIPTPTTQQHAELSTSAPEISSTTPHVQRIWNPITAISNAVSSAAEWVGDSIDSAVDYIKERAAEFVSEMPGYSLFTVVYGSDPITGRRVERNGRNFINAGLDVIPNGEALKQKLEQEGALDEAAQWLDNEIAELDFNPSEIANQFANFWSSLSLADATRIPTVLDRLSSIILEPLGRIRRFAVNVARELLRIIKDYVVSSLINFIREQTNAYPLLTVILGRDPISDEVVERTPIALLRGFMQLSESGQEQLRQMEESGSLQRATEWLDGAVARLNISWEVISASFSAAWNLVTIENLLDPIGTFRELYNIFAGPVGRIINFVIEVGIKVLGFIKDALVGRLVTYARTVRGYPLISVILGKDPISQAPVERNTANIIHGFMSLMENGEQQYQEMAQSGAIARMSARVEAAMAVLNFTWDYIRGLFTRAWNSFTLQDLAAPIEAFGRLMQIFADPIMRLLGFVAEIIKVVIEVLMEVMNFPIDLIRNIITRAMQAIEDIKRDPMGFLKNLLRAVKTGFQQFFNNILQHLFDGVTGWLFSEMRDANINPPADLSFQSILGFVLEVLGITVERIWEKLAERIGEERVARIRGMIDRLTGIWTFVKDVATRGPVAIWEYIQERLSNLWGTVLEAVRNWVVTRIVQRVTARLLSMLDPTGIMTVINGFIAFYNAIQSFIRYLREMLEIVNSFVVGVAELARGNVTIAADFLEASLARAMPVAIGFLANQVGLSGIGRRIGEMIERVRGMVDQALTWLVDRAVSVGTSFLNVIGLGGGTGDGTADTGGIDADNVIGEVMTVNAEGETHTLYIDRNGSNAQIMMRSEEKPVRQHFTEMQARINAIANPAKKQQAQSHWQQGNSKINELDTLADQEASLTQSAQSGSGNSGQNTNSLQEVENNVRVKENELKVIIENILNLVNEDVREALGPYLNQPYSNFESALNNDPDRLGLARYYRIYSVNEMKIIVRRGGQAEAAPKLRVVDGELKEHDGRPSRHWDGILNYNNGQRSRGWLGAVSGGGTNPSQSFVTHGLDARGHLIGAQFTGSNGPENLAAQQRTANSPTYTDLENPLKQLMVNTSMTVKMDVQTSGSTSRADWQRYFSDRDNVNLVSDYRRRTGPPENFNDADVPDSYLNKRPEQYNIRITHFQRVPSNGVIANAGETGSDIGTLAFSTTVTNPVEDGRANLSNDFDSFARILETANTKFNEQGS